MAFYSPDSSRHQRVNHSSQDSDPQQQQQHQQQQQQHQQQQRPTIDHQTFSSKREDNVKAEIKALQVRLKLSYERLLLLPGSQSGIILYQITQS